jgi:hypothetical protein
VHLLLIPVARGVPALDAYFGAHPDDGHSMTADELQALARLAARVIETSELLVRYAVAIAGTPLRN